MSMGSLRRKNKAHSHLGLAFQIRQVNKQHYPKTPVVVLRFHSSESFPEADGTVSDDPDIWMAAVASTLKKSA